MSTIAREHPELFDDESPDFLDPLESNPYDLIPGEDY